MAAGPNLAVVAHAADDLRVEEVPEPTPGPGEAVVRNSARHAESASRSFFVIRSVALFSCPQAAKMSRPRGVRTGEA